MYEKIENFEIAFNGVTTKVTPVINGVNMRFIVHLPHRSVLIEMVLDPDEIQYWQEVPGGRSDLSEELGHLIELKDG